MAATDSHSGPGPREKLALDREKVALGLVEAAGAGGTVGPERVGDPSAPPMAVSIAGISTACSTDALVSSAKAVRRRLAAE